jgi:hypothetical protein
LNNACITAALVLLLSVSAASAEDKAIAPYDSIQSSHLAISLHSQAHRLAHKLEYHYPFTSWARHQGSTIAHTAHQLEQDVASGHALRCRRELQCLQKQLNQVELLMRRSIALHGRADGVHIRGSLKQMQEIATSLERSLELAEISQTDHNTLEWRIGEPAKIQRRSLSSIE